MQVVLIHEGSAVGANAIDSKPAIPWEGPVLEIVKQIQDTTVDVVMGGHTHRITNTVVGHILVTEEYNAGVSYTVNQLVVKDGDVIWAGGANRIAKNLGVARRADVQAIIDEANAQTAVLRNKVIGTQAFDILRDPTRLKNWRWATWWRTRCWRNTPGSMRR